MKSWEIRQNSRHVWIDRACRLQFYALYSMLKDDLGEGMLDSNNRNFINTLFGSRALVLPLNLSPFRNEELWKCSMCNSGEREDVSFPW